MCYLRKQAKITDLTYLLDIKALTQQAKGAGS